MCDGVIFRHDYPLSLRLWNKVPPQLWYLGDRTLIGAETLVAVIGTRKPSNHGVSRTAKVTRELVSHGAVVVSGMAEGVDFVAHTTALGLRGMTIAVMGTEISACYPRRHLDLKGRIVSAGLVLSQFPPGSRTEWSNFPRRNELMAAMSSLTVVVEASASSGTRHQVAACVRIGRPVGFLASLFQAGYRWVDDAINSGLGFVIDSPEQLRDALQKIKGSDLATGLPNFAFTEHQEELVLDVQPPKGAGPQGGSSILAVSVDGVPRIS